MQILVYLTSQERRLFARGSGGGEWLDDGIITIELTLNLKGENGLSRRAITEEELQREGPQQPHLPLCSWRRFWDSQLLSSCAWLVLLGWERADSFTTVPQHNMAGMCWPDLTVTFRSHKHLIGPQLSPPFPGSCLLWALVKCVSWRCPTNGCRGGRCLIDALCWRLVAANWWY